MKCGANARKQKKFLALPMASRRQSWVVLSAKPSFADARPGRRQIDQIFANDRPSTKSFSCFFKIKKIPDDQPSAKKFRKK
jgi:hypothetical protein